MKRCGFFSLYLLVAVAACADDLPRNGLALWMDASTQAAARKAASLPPIGNLQPVDFLLDNSSNAPNATQIVAEKRAILISDGETACLKFDGKDDFLSVTGPRRSTPALTVFVLAAPTTNNGNFAALFATSQTGANDYTGGLSFDFGPNPTLDLSVLNGESAGATGFQNLLVPGVMNAASRPFGDFHVFTVRSRVGKAGTEVFLDGFKGGERDRAESVIGLDQMVLGARFYSNDPSQPPYAQGFFEGMIAAVLVYDRALTDEERTGVEQILLAKRVALHALIQGAKGHSLEAVKDPPAVQMLVPGFAVRELPLKLGNLNNVRYRYDGKLVALGYDGSIHLLSDTDGDGLEDKDEIFWKAGSFRGPIGMALTPRGDPRGDGVFVASKGKVSLVLDKDRDGQADEEQVVATGWKETFHTVDTLGVAVDPKDGWVYFGISCVNFADAYLVDKATGRSLYDLQDPHGTIQRLSPDFSKRETVCTGVRFTCALAFNSLGDLFATDQEGATWLPNGNPLDELLQIEPGKHYGFPPRHPKYNPTVRDEPAVSEFAPQHQSTVGMVFNEGVNGGPRFGPAHWAGDALITGASRGKLWRTKLAKTPLGYVAQNHLIACLTMLAVDCCVSPDGSLIVACHSGPPDWGTGPTGQGRVFKIKYSGRDLPQPVLAWAAGLDEFRVAFDRPLNPSDWAGGRQKTRIEAGAYVSAGDRFEVLRPGYQVVRDQLAASRRWVDVIGLTLSEDRRTLSLSVPRQTEPVNYAITLPLPEKWKQSSEIPQHPQVDVMATLNGLSATVMAKGRQLQCIIPHPSLAAATTLTSGSADHEAFLKVAAAPEATVALNGFVDVANPYVPAIQPGSKLDWDMAKDSFASTIFGIRTDYAKGNETVLDVSGVDRYRQFKTAAVKNPVLSANGLFLAHDDLRHSISTAKLRVPWAVQPDSNFKSEPVVANRTDVKGDWLSGRRLFFRDAGCVTCHTIRSEGFAFGPDLSNLIYRDRESVLHDIREPSATINPDHPGTLVTLTNGTSFSGIIRSLNDEKITLDLPAGEVSEIPRAKVASVAPMKTSLMTQGLLDQFSPEQVEDLLTFLLVNPLDAAPITRLEPPTPPARSLDEVRQVMNSARPVPGWDQSPLLILLCSGPKDHGLDEHDYPLWLSRWSRLLPLARNVGVQTAESFPTAEQLARCDVAVFFNGNPGWGPQEAAMLDDYHKRGGGAVYLHYAIDGGKDGAGVAERMGFAFTLGSRFRHGELDLTFKDSKHPITQGLPTLHFTDETYWNLRGDCSRIAVLGTALEDNAPQPQLWTLEREKSRIVGCIPGHYSWTFDDPLYRVLVLRSICWAAKQHDVDRLSDLCLVGVRIH